MTLPTATVPARTADAGARPAPVHRHPGCYWDVTRAAWVRWTPMPLPRPSQD
ncbi:hypothetical protein GCU56_12975 [Geodermatophilus sabuli]|uniref:Uncharacterized protein n=1 Tax=Geodermatophilus sabuli TaxID=1564158 RepID=A0A7K3W1X4_9ACTN|nr:hypothetical protein [Geodermatophilus sabuli]NEK58782.1 hypothetical protein [Geodermatophilus sabuli]